ncbi:MAG: glutamine--tRNA ligase, partial [Phycisphaeraceae bacterium]
PDGRRPKGTIHWVSAAHALDAEIRLYEHLFTQEDPEAGLGEDEDFTKHLSPDSQQILAGCKVEPSLAELTPDAPPVQFERTGYFKLDPDTEPGRPVFNRVVTLRDTWAKMMKQGKTR